MTEHCYGCAQLNTDLMGNPTSGRVGESTFMDTRTGRTFCAECMSALLSWELDGCPDDPDLPYVEWTKDHAAA